MSDDDGDDPDYVPPTNTFLLTENDSFTVTENGFPSVKTNQKLLLPGVLPPDPAEARTLTPLVLLPDPVRARTTTPLVLLPDPVRARTTTPLVLLKQI